MNPPNSKWNANEIRNLFPNNADVNMDEYVLGSDGALETVYLVFCEGLADLQQINQFVLPQLEQMIHVSQSGVELDKKMDLTRIDQLKDVEQQVFDGYLVLYFEKMDDLYALDIASPPHRNPEESNTEISIKGPRDGFVEELSINVALVRKRLRTSSMRYEQFVIGRRSRSKVALLYIEDIINPAYVKEARHRLQNIDVDTLFSAHQLEKLIADYSPSFFPLVDYTGRPDYVADCLVHGRFAVIVDGAPAAVIAPANLTLLLKSPEDVYFPYYFVTFGLFLRLIGLVVSLFLPGFWAALASYNIEQLPFPLLATIAISRIGLPFPGPLEAFLMVGLFELFREAGERLPKAVGQTIAVVGGIVIGDAAIRAGLASTTLLVIAAVTAIASFTLVNQSLVGSVSVIRMLVLACSSFLGMYGFILSGIAIILYLSRLESFGVAYLAPLSPIKWKDILEALIRKPWYKQSRRPDMLNTKNSMRKGGK